MMKILLYFEGMKFISKSGIGKALSHQKAALTYEGIEFTLDPGDDFDLAHINTIGPGSLALIRKCRRLGKKVVIHAHSDDPAVRDGVIKLADKLGDKLRYCRAVVAARTGFSIAQKSVYLELNAAKEGIPWAF